MSDRKIIVGDCLEVMRGMGSGSVQTCITSPPYFGLRDYGVEGQIGLEATPEAFVAKMVEVFREVRRLLRDDGTLWLNLGDSYAGTGGQGPQRGAAMKGRSRQRDTVTTAARTRGPGLKPKDMVGIPWRVAFALQADGWYLRQDIIWSKPNPMPESVTDRCTKAHEYMFLLSKSPRYYFDSDAILEPCSPATHARLSQAVQDQIGSTRANGGSKTNGNMKAVGRGSNGVGWGYADGTDAKPRTQGRKLATNGDATKNNPSFDAAMAIMPSHRNKRSVWTVPTMPFKEAHFATYPERLIEPCILAGAPAGGLVLDPFMGAGTTAVVAERLGRRWTGCELNPEYAAIAEARIKAVQPGLPLGDVA